jgi:hypothetical protein
VTPSGDLALRPVPISARTERFLPQPAILCSRLLAVDSLPQAYCLSRRTTKTTHEFGRGPTSQRAQQDSSEPRPAPCIGSLQCSSEDGRRRRVQQSDVTSESASRKVVPPPGGGTERIGGSSRTSFAQPVVQATGHQNARTETATVRPLSGSAASSSGSAADCFECSNPQSISRFC